MALSQAQHRSRLVDANRAVIARIRASVAPLADQSLGQRPPGGGWSVAEVLEHLIVSADSYLAALRRVLARKDASPADDTTTWRPSLMGGLLTASLRSERK